MSRHDAENADFLASPIDKPPKKTSILLNLLTPDRDLWADSHIGEGKRPMAHADDWDDIFWGKLLRFLNLPNEQRYMTLIQQVVTAIADGNRPLAERDAKSLAYLIRSEQGIIDPLTEENDLIGVDRDADIKDLTKRVLETAELAMDMDADEFDNIENDPRYDPANGGLDLNGKTGDADGGNAPPPNDDTPPPGPGGSGGQGGDTPGGNDGGGGSAGGTPSGNDEKSGKDDKKSGGEDKEVENFDPKVITKVDIAKVAQTIRDNGEKAGRDTAEHIAEILIGEGNREPEGVLVEQLYEQAIALIIEEDEAEAREIAERAKRDPSIDEIPSTVVNGGQAQPERNTMDRVAGEMRDEEQRDARLADFQDELDEIEFNLLSNDESTALELAQALAERLKTVRGKLAGVSAQQIIKLLARIAKKRTEDAAVENALNGTAATIFEVWDSVLFQRVSQQIQRADAAGDIEKAKKLLAEALGLARNTALNLGITQTISARDILQAVFPPERIQEYDERMARAAQRAAEPEITRPTTMDRVAFEQQHESFDGPDPARSSGQIQPEDSASQQGGGFQFPGGLVRLVAEAFRKNGIAMAREVAGREAGRLHGQVPGTVEEIAGALLEHAGVRPDPNREPPRADAQQAPRQRPPSGFLAHVTDVDRFMRFDRMMGEVAQMVADEDPKMMVKAKALVKMFRDDKGLFTDSVTPEDFLEFCVQRAGPKTPTQRADDNPYGYGPDEEPAEQNGHFSIAGALKKNSALAKIFAEIVELMRTDPKEAAKLAMRLARQMIEIYGLKIDPKKLAAEIMKMVRKAIKARKTKDRKPSDDQDGPDDRSQGGNPGAGQQQPTLTRDHVKQTDWDGVAGVYFGDSEDSEEMRSIAFEIIKKGEDNAGVTKSAKDLLAKSKKAKKGKFKNFNHVIAAIKDAVFKRASGKKVTKPLKASEIPDDKDEKKAA